MEKEKETMSLNATCARTEPVQMSAALTEQYMMLHGLSKRDIIAAMAMQGILSSEYAQGWRPEEVCRVAFRYADEFLKQSEKPVEQ